MVHRAPDSRLLTQLIAHEKDYGKQLTALFPLSHAALASLSAYAAATTEHAHPIAAVVDALASADDALQRYTHAIDTWRDQLAALKALEDDLVAILRDRDILVTRLIKASKSTREAHRTSRLVPPLSNLGSSSLSSLPSTNSGTTSSAPASTNSKLAQAQAELQACEAHLVTKERELDARRISVAREGLGARCRALIDCGWVWSEMGKQGLKALQALSPATTASDTPSQSVSQARPVDEPASHTREDSDLPPAAHATSGVAFPTSVRAPSPHTSEPVPPRRRRTRRRRPPSQHIPEVSDEGSSASHHGNATPFPARARAPGGDASSEDERSGPLQVVDNDPFEVIRRSMLSPPAHASAPDVRAGGTWDTPLSTGAFPSSISVEREGERGLLSVPGSLGRRQRKASMAFFGSLRGLFRKPKEKERTTGVAWDEGPSSPRNDNANGSARSRENGKWVTRTDARIKQGSQDSDDDPTPTPTQTQSRTGRDGTGARLRKGRPRENGTAGSRRRTVDGWITDGPADAGARAVSPTGPGRSRTRRATMKRRKTSVADLRGSEQGHTDGEVEGRATSGPEEAAPSSTQHRRAATTTATARSVSDGTHTIAHRRSASLSVGAHMSVSSSASSSSAMSWRKPPPQIEPVPRSESPARRRTPSPESSARAPAAKRLGNGHAVHAHKRVQQSLMSIVADVVVDATKTESLDVPRAPGSVLDESGNQDSGRHGRRASEDGRQGQGQGVGQGQRAIKMPLRSALRNTSRTPSPGPASVPVTLSVVPAQQGEDEKVVPASLRDSASISSYETGRENLDGEESPPTLPSPSHSPPPPPDVPAEASVPRLPSPPPFSFPPPPVEPPPAGAKEGEQLPSSSNASTETPPVRRKSVRVSLQPTFSPSPPALYDEEPGNVWADSSEEDEVYSRAKRLLSLVGSKARVRS